MQLRWILALLLLPCVPSFSQSRTVNGNGPQLSSAALAKLKTIAALSTLPGGDWHYHAGDLPHGESADSSSWPILAPKSEAATDAVWFRRTVEVPRTLNGYDISGSRVSFQFHADANGPMPQIIYFNGRRVALGDDLEPIILFDSARPGDKVDVAVKLLRTVDVKRFGGVTLQIEPASASGTAASASKAARPSPEDIRIECLAAGSILPALPTPRLDLLPKVEEAVAAINIDALNRPAAQSAQGQRAFDLSLIKAQALLDPLKPILAEANVTLTGNSHIDAAWLWPASETVDVVKRTFTSALQLMNEYPDYTFTQSAAQYSEWMADKYPKLNDQIRDRIKEGRWEIVGGMWVEPDLNLPDGESLVRQLLLGQRYFKKNYGVTARIGWNPDSFGYTWQLPQIYKRSGLDYFVTQKMHWNDTNQLPFRLFYWQSPDGSKVLTYFPTDYVHSSLNPARIAVDFNQSAERNAGTRDMMDLYGIGDHGGGPTRAMLDEGDRFVAASNKQLALPAMHYGTAQHYFSTVEKKIDPSSSTWNYSNIAAGYKLDPAPAGQMNVPTWKDELYFEYHRGVFTTQAKHKANMRRSEVETIDAEKLASLAWLDGAAYPNSALTSSWRKITFNQFHDLAAGSGIGVIYRDAQKDYTEVFESDHEIAENSLHILAANIDTRVKGDTPLLIFNPLAWPRSETVKLDVQLPEHADSVRILDTRNKPVLTQVLSSNPGTNTFTLLVRAEEIPSLGYKVLHAVKADNPDKEPTTLRVAEDPNAFTLENSALHLTIDRKTGCITSLVDLKTKTDSIAPSSCGNQLQTFVDTPKDYDAWNIDPGTLDHNTPIQNVDSIAITDHGPLRSTVRIMRTWQSSKFIQDISLDAFSDTVDIANQIDWHETHVLLKAAFPLSATSAKATYEIPYGSIERSTERKNSWEQAQFEVPAMRWADLGSPEHGLSLLNDSKYGYDAAGNTLRLSLLRSPTWPDPEADRGPQSFRYALYPHAGDWKTSQTMHRGYEFNYPVTATQVVTHTGSLPAEHSWASVENPNVTLTAIKKAEDSNALIFRMVEWAGQESVVKLHLPAGATAATEANLMEKPEAQPLTVTGDTVSIPIHPFEILTIQATYPSRENASSENPRGETPRSTH